MPSRKRTHQEVEPAAVADQVPREPSVLERLRNMWQFANLMQFLFIFGKAVRIDCEDFGIEDLEAECLRPDPSAKLAEIGLALLKFVSTQRGLNADLFDEYARRLYQARSPGRRNPFGDAERPEKFSDFDIFKKIRVLWQLSQWTFVHCEKLRERMAEQKDAEEQAFWRVEPTGWDADDRTYFVLDDNRLYRRTDPAPPSPPLKPKPKPKKNSKKARAAARASKRRKLASGDAEDSSGANDDAAAATTTTEADPATSAEPNPPAEEDSDDGLGGCTWECIAVTLDEYKAFVAGLRGSDDANERILYDRCVKQIMPAVEKVEEERQRVAARKEKELRAMVQLATAKRSSRIASKAERQREEAAAQEAQRKRAAELAAERKEQARQAKLGKERESRILTRESRLRERETRRALHEKQLAELEQGGEGRMSQRHLKAEKERRQKALDELASETDWFFDCSGCGVHGDNLDDGTGIIACGQCNVWQHLSCLGLSQEQAERSDFEFVCDLCKRRQADREKSAKNPIKLDFRKLGASASPPVDEASLSASASGSASASASASSSSRGQKRKAATLTATATPTTNTTTPSATSTTTTTTTTTTNSSAASEKEEDEEDEDLAGQMPPSKKARLGDDSSDGKSGAGGEEYQPAAAFDDARAKMSGDAVSVNDDHTDGGDGAGVNSQKGQVLPGAQHLQLGAEQSKGDKAVKVHDDADDAEHAQPLQSALAKDGGDEEKKKVADGSAQEHVAAASLEDRSPGAQHLHLGAEQKTRAGGEEQTQRVIDEEEEGKEVAADSAKIQMGNDNDDARDSRLPGARHLQLSAEPNAEKKGDEQAKLADNEIAAAADDDDDARDGIDKGDVQNGDRPGAQHLQLSAEPGRAEKHGEQPTSNHDASSAAVTTTNDVDMVNGTNPESDTSDSFDYGEANGAANGLHHHHHHYNHHDRFAAGAPVSFATGSNNGTHEHDDANGASSPPRHRPPPLSSSSDLFRTPDRSQQQQQQSSPLVPPPSSAAFGLSPSSTSVLPPPSSGRSPTKRSPPPPPPLPLQPLLSSEAGGIMTGVFAGDSTTITAAAATCTNTTTATTNNGTLFSSFSSSPSVVGIGGIGGLVSSGDALPVPSSIPPGPTLTPTPSRVDPTPPQKKLVPAPLSPPPAALLASSLSSSPSLSTFSSFSSTVGLNAGLDSGSGSGSSSARHNGFSHHHHQPSLHSRHVSSSLLPAAAAADAANGGSGQAEEDEEEEL